MRPTDYGNEPLLSPTNVHLHDGLIKLWAEMLFVCGFFCILVGCMKKKHHLRRTRRPFLARVTTRRRVAAAPDKPPKSPSAWFKPYYWFTFVHFFKTFFFFALRFTLLPRYPASVSHTLPHVSRYSSPSLHPLSSILSSELPTTIRTNGHVHHGRNYEAKELS